MKGWDTAKSPLEAHEIFNVGVWLHFRFSESHCNALSLSHTHAHPYSWREQDFSFSREFCDFKKSPVLKWNKKTPEIQKNYFFLNFILVPLKFFILSKSKCFVLILIFKTLYIMQQNIKLKKLK